MRTVRRLYFYTVALISIEVVLWGLIDLLRSIVDQTVGGEADALARALALILVGLPIFLFHWLWTQRSSSRDDDERTASVRAIFFYSVLIGTLIPLVQNLLALINRSLLNFLKLDASRAILGGTQTGADNLIAILMNGLVALYFWNILRREWLLLPLKENFADVRRLYRYIWVLYSLLMAIFGAQQILRYLFYVPSNVLGELTSETVVNGLALLLVGAAVWFYSWRLIQNSLTEAGESASNLRLGILYALALSGVITVLTTSAMLIKIILSRLLGTIIPVSDLIYQIGGPISIGLPLGAVWAYYGQWLNRHIESISEPVRRSSLKRVYSYILSALGLGGTFIGVATLIKFIIDLLTGGSLVLSDVLRSNLARAISLIIAWLPLWLLTWRPVQAAASRVGDEGDHARRSVVRRVYLYLALFAGVIGGMISAVALAYELLNAVLTGATGVDFLATILNDLQLVVLFTVLLVFHLSILRRDSLFTADALAKKQNDFRVLVLDSGAGFADSIKTALTKAAPNIPLTIVKEKPQASYNALILNGSAVVSAPEWIRSFDGKIVVIPSEAEGLIWAGGVSKQVVQQAAQAVRQLAEGQDTVQQSSGSGWRVVLYIAAALFGLEVLLGIVGLVISAFVH